MVDWWEPLDVRPSSVLRITSLPRAEGIMFMRNRSNNLVSDWYEPNAATDDSEATSSPTVIAETPSQYNPTKEIQSKPIQAQIGGSLGGATNDFIILTGQGFPTIILYSLRGVYVCRKESKESIKIFNMDGYNVSPTIDSVEHSTKKALAVYSCIL